MDVSTCEIGDALVLEFKGTFPRANSEQAGFRARVANTVPDSVTAERVVFVLPPMTSITSAELGLIIGCYVSVHRKIGLQGTRSVGIVAAEESVRKMFHVVDSNFETHATLDEALGR